MINNLSMIGDIRTSKFPYYDKGTDSIRYKARPCLIVGTEKEQGSSDITMIPISTIGLKQNIHAEYDIEAKKKIYPNLNLDADCSYIRTHKVSTVHSTTIGKTPICSMKQTYPTLYALASDKHKEFTTSLFQ